MKIKFNNDIKKILKLEFLQMEKNAAKLAQIMIIKVTQLQTFKCCGLFENTRNYRNQVLVIKFFIIYIIIIIIWLSWLFFWQVKKSMVTTEVAHSKGSAGQASGGAKGSLAKTPVNVFSSPNLKNSWIAWGIYASFRNGGTFLESVRQVFLFAIMH